MIDLSFLLNNKIANFGANSENSNSNNNSAINSPSLFGVENGSFLKTGNPEQDAINYASENGISLEEAKNELRAKYGDPPKRLDYKA